MSLFFLPNSNKNNKNKIFQSSDPPRYIIHEFIATVLKHVEIEQNDRIRT